MYNVKKMMKFDKTRTFSMPSITGIAGIVWLRWTVSRTQLHIIANPTR